MSRTPRSRRPKSSQPDPGEYLRRAPWAAIAAHCFAMVGFKDAGAEVFDYGNSPRRGEAGRLRARLRLPRLRPRLLRPLFCEGKGPFRWVAPRRSGRHRRHRPRRTGGISEEDEAPWAVMRTCKRDRSLIALPARDSPVQYIVKLALAAFNDTPLHCTLIADRALIDPDSVCHRLRLRDWIDVDGSDASSTRSSLNAFPTPPLFSEWGIWMTGAMIAASIHVSCLSLDGGARPVEASLGVPTT